jgi:hypothetical protein
MYIIHNKRLNTPHHYDKCDREFDLNTCWNSKDDVKTSGYTSHCHYDEELGQEPLVVDLSTIHAARKISKGQSNVLTYGDDCHVASRGVYYLYVKSNNVVNTNENGEEKEADNESKDEVSFSVLITSMAKTSHAEFMCTDNTSPSTTSYRIKMIWLSIIIIGFVICVLCCCCISSYQPRRQQNEVIVLATHVEEMEEGDERTKGIATLVAYRT